MLFQLDTLQTKKNVTREISLAREEIGTNAGKTVVEDIQASLRFRHDPMGYVVHYKVTARAAMPCSRCGEMVSQRVEGNDWVSLRNFQPQESHVNLDDAQMNVRFITSLKFDMVAFIVEAIELELPTYPRHEETDPKCNIADSEAQTLQAPSSPFSKLSRYLP